MSLVPMGGYKPAPHPGLMNDVPGFFAAMGITAENVASRYDVSRQAQDEFALESHLRALKAQENGWFDDASVQWKLMVKQLPRMKGRVLVRR